MLLGKGAGPACSADKKSLWNAIPDVLSPSAWWKMKHATNSVSVKGLVSMITRQKGTEP